jgi:hypothetical protein
MKVIFSGAPTEAGFGSKVLEVRIAACSTAIVDMGEVYGIRERTEFSIMLVFDGELVIA